MPTDLSQYSDADLEKIASGNQPAAAPDLSHYSDADLHAIANQGTLLGNVLGGTPTEQAIPKAMGTAAIKGVASIPSMWGGQGQADMVDYLMARAHSAISGEPTEDVLKRYKQRQDEFKEKAGPIGRAAETIAPRNVIPSGEQLAAPILERTGEYKPESLLGQIGMAGTEMAASGWGPGIGSKVGAFTKPGTFNALKEMATDALKMAPANFVAGSTGEAVTQATGDPLAGLLTGMVVPHVGGQVLDALGRPIKKFAEPMFASNRPDMADSLFYQMFTDPKAAYENLKNRNYNLLTGAPASTAELAMDPGALLAQKNAENANNDFKVRMDQIRNEQNRVRVESLKSMAPEGADVLLPSRTLADQADTINKAHDDIINNLVDNAVDLHNAMPAGTKPEDTGSAIREMTNKAMIAARQERSNLYKQVDPDQKMSVITENARKTGENLKNSIDPNVSIPSSNAAPVIDMVANLNDVTPYHKLIDLDSTITNQMAQAKRAGDWTGHGQLRTLKEAVMADIHNAVDNQHAWEQAAVKEGKLNPDDTIEARLKRYGAGTVQQPGDASTASAASAVGTGTNGATGVPQEGVAERGPSGRLPSAAAPQGVPSVEPKTADFTQDLNNYTIHYPHGQLQARYEVVDLPSLVTSHGPDLNVNSKYPQELQPRERSMAGSQQQIEDIANKLNPELLGPAKEANSGAPIVGPDNVVESGNGRTLALSKAYDGPNGQKYRNWLESNGFDTTGMEKPVLIARRTSEMTPQERELFTRSTASQTGLALSASEKARADAKMAANIDEPVKFGNVGNRQNADFVRKFTELLPASERATIMDRNGNLSAEGERRIEAAITSRAFGDSPIVEKAFMDRDNDIKSITNSMIDAAGPWHEMRKAASEGRIPTDADITDNLLEAISLVSKAKSEDLPRGFYLNQADFFRSPLQERVRAMLSPDGKNIGSQKFIAQALNNYAEEALKNVKEGRLFEGVSSTDDVLKAALDKTARENGVNLREVAPGQPAEAAPEAPKKLTEGSVFNRPSFEQEAADKLAQAKKAHAEFAQTYRQEPIKGTLADYGYAGQYKIPSGSVPDRAFPAGSRGFEATNAFLKANNNSPEIIANLQQTAVNKLRDIMGSDPFLTQKKLDTWKSRFDSSLRAIDQASPGFLSKFDDLAAATESLNSAKKANMDRIDLEKKMAANQIIGAPTAEEMRSRVGSLLSSTDGATKIKEIMSRLAGNQDAIDGLRRAATEHMLERFSNASFSGDERTLSGAKFNKFLTSNADALEAMYGKEGLANMRRIGADLDRTQQAMDAVKARTGSDTAQNLFSEFGKIIQSGQKGSLGSVFAIAGMEAFDKLGVLGALGVGTTAAIKNAVDRMRASGVKDVNDLVLRGLEDPSVGAAMLQRAIDKNGKPDVSALNRLASTLTKGSQYMQEEEQRRRGRASGGRIERSTGGGAFDHETEADKLVRAAERAKNDVNKTTEPLLNVDDNTIARALDVAQAAI